jgi:ribonuclease Z
MRFLSISLALVSGVVLAAFAPGAIAQPCLIVTLTGTQTGPGSYNGLAGPGTLVRYGEDGKSCDAVKLQFDAGRGTSMRLSSLGIGVQQLDAIFFTHVHSDHVDGFADILQQRWHFNSTGPKLDVVCSSDANSPLGFTMSCKKLVSHVADSYIESGEIAQRISEDKVRLSGGPADLAQLKTFTASNEAQVVWSRGVVRVSAIRSTHVAGHASYRVDTPAGSVVIGGDAGNDVPAPPRATSTSAQVEKLAMGADVIVHSAFHPVMGPERDSGMPLPVFYRQSLASDLGAMAKRTGAKYLMLTHLGPPLGADKQGPWKVPGGPLDEADYRKAVQASGFDGTVVVGTDLASVKLGVQ